MVLLVSTLDGMVPSKTPLKKNTFFEVKKEVKQFMSENKLKEHYYEKGIITALWETGES